MIGVYAKNKKYISDETKKGIIDLVINITLPFTIVVSFNQKLSIDLIKNAGIILGISFVIHIGSFFLSEILFKRYSDDMKSVLRYSTIFSNATFMGYPILEGLYGGIGIFYASIYLLPYRILMWTFGVALFAKTKKQDYFKEILLNPGILAVIIGLVISATPIEIPLILTKTMKIVGSMTTPLSMIIVGASLADINIKGVFKEGALWYNSLIRLIILPIISLILFRALGVKDIVLAVAVLLTAMPTGAMTAILAGRYGANSNFASKCVFTSTTLSMITIPIIAMLIS
jgi:predicted permease